MLFALFLAAMGAIVYHIHSQKSALVEAQALQSAEQLTNVLAEFRTLYTSEVVERVRHQGIEVTHDYKPREGAIPLPATLSMLLASRLNTKDSEIKTRLYSAFPFPWRGAEGGLSDDFTKDAWAFLNKTPDIPFYRIETSGGVPVLRYATADLMRAACVDCHNTNANSPKTDWKIGDVRGVLEIIVPLTAPVLASKTGLMKTAILLLVLTLAGLLIISLILGDLRRVASEAQDSAKQAHEANRRLEESNLQELEKINVDLKFQKHALDEHAIVSITDVEGIMTYVNDKFCEISGYASEELIGQNHRILKSGEHLPELYADLWRTISNGETWRGEIKNQKKNGEFYWVTATIVPFLNKDGKPFQYVAIRTEITEEKEKEAEVFRAMEIAKSADLAKSEFLASMSHELRTPLNAVIGFSEVMMSESFGPMGNERYVDYVGDIHASGKHLLGLINDILDLSKIDAGKTELHEETFDPVEVIQSCLRMVKGQARGNGVQLVTDFPDRMSLLCADQRMLKQILLNLLSNAIKFTPEGGEVTLKAWSQPGSGHVFQIIDSGIGVALDDIPKILRPFTQIESTLSRKHQGTGLGLPLAKNLVELQGGYLDFQSEFGVGSTVTVRFPKERIVEQEDKPASSLAS